MKKPITTYGLMAEFETPTDVVAAARAAREAARAEEEGKRSP